MVEEGGLGWGDPENKLGRIEIPKGGFQVTDSAKVGPEFSPPLLFDIKFTVLITPKKNILHADKSPHERTAAFLSSFDSLATPRQGRSIWVII